MCYLKKSNQEKFHMSYLSFVCHTSKSFKKKFKLEKVINQFHFFFKRHYNDRLLNNSDNNIVL